MEKLIQIICGRNLSSITIKPGSQKKLFIIIENMEQVAKQL